MADQLRLFAVVTGASTGIGFELAKQCPSNGFDLLIAAEEPEAHEAAEMLQRHGGAVGAVEADLATTQGVLIASAPRSPTADTWRGCEMSRGNAPDRCRRARRGPGRRS